MKLTDEILKSGLKNIADIDKRPSLPRFDELPNIDLYMDQVMALINRYLAFFSVDDESEIITRSMINNYVKMKIIPIPVKKKYSRIHLACLIMIGALKQSLSIQTISALLPNDMDEDGCRHIYDKFVNSWDNSFDMASQMLISQFEMIAKNKQYDEAIELATDMAVGSNIFKVFTEKMLVLSPLPEKEEK